MGLKESEYSEKLVIMVCRQTCLLIIKTVRAKNRGVSWWIGDLANLAAVAKNGTIVVGVSQLREKLDWF